MEVNLMVTSEWELDECEQDHGSNLSEACVTGSRPREDRILEHEQRCQEQEDSLPRSSTSPDQVEAEQDCSSARVGTNAATWEASKYGCKSSTVPKTRCIHPMQFMQIRDEAQRPSVVNSTLYTAEQWSSCRIRCTIKPSPKTIKRKRTTPKVMYLPGIHVM